jgi:hypothetical protein
MLALVLVAVGCGGMVGGWLLANGTVVAQAPQPEATILEVPLAEPGESSTMPDVRGLAESDALQVLVDAGIPARAVTVSSRPAGGTPGTVVDQTPAFGTAAPATVELTIGEAAMVPDLQGREIDDAVAALNDLGTRVERASGYDPDSEPGVILSSAPDAGEALPDTVSLVVNAAPSAVYLAELSPLRGGCSSPSRLFLDGDAFTQGLECGATASGRSSTWLLAKSVDRVTGVVGVGDTAEPGTIVHVEITADGKILFAEDVAYADPQPLDVRTTGALQLSVTATTVSAPGGSSAEAALGDVRLLGASEAIAALRSE